MKFNWIGTLAISSALACTLHGQSYRRNASITGGGNGSQGKCTIEVVVDGVADVEIRGTTATLRNLSGQQPQWRRFECTSPMPANPPNFGFTGVDGRGTQNLTRDPRNGGVAVVRIEDRDNGSEGYTFDLIWDSRGQGYNTGPFGNNAPIGRNQQDPNYDGYPNRQMNDDRYRPGYQDTEYYRRYNHGFPKEEAIRTCQNEVIRQASARFPRAEVHFDRTRTDDQPGRNDWVVGMLDVHRPRAAEQYRFSCSVDFSTGRVRSAEIDARPLLSNR